MVLVRDTHSNLIDWMKMEHEPLIDVSQIPVENLMNSSNPALTRAVDQLLKDIDDPNGVLSAFGSFVGTD